MYGTGLERSMPTIINPEDWQLRTAAEGGLPSSAHNGAAVMDSSMLNAPRSQLLHDANPFLCILEEPANHHSPVHYHTEPELMIVLKGKMLLSLSALVSLKNDGLHARVTPMAGIDLTF